MKATTLTKTRSILTRIATGRTHVSFASHSEDDGSIDRHVEVRRATWDDLGQPEQITLTIEPGDLLNDEETR